MEGELSWNIIHDAIDLVAKGWPEAPARRGHPDVWPLDVVVLVWLYASFYDIPLVHAVAELNCPIERKCKRIKGLRIPAAIPHATTVARRAKRPDFAEFVLEVQRRLAGRADAGRDVLIIDSTPLRVPHTSRDGDATHGHHRMRGYRIHTACWADGTIAGAVVRGSHVHDLRAGAELATAVARGGSRARYVLADTAYDSERFHAHVQAELGASLIAPLNSRGGTHSMRRTPRRKAMRKRMGSRLYVLLYRKRTVIERRFSTLKCSKVRLDRLPGWIRRLGNTDRWVQLKIVVALAHDVHRKRRLRRAG